MFFEFTSGLFIRRDCVESITVVTNSGNSHDTKVKTVSGAEYAKNFFTLTEAEAERDRLLAEDL